MKKYIKYTLFFATILSLGACKKFTEGLDVSPNSPTSATPGLLLNGAQVASILVYEGNLARTAGMFSRSFTGSDRQYIGINNYTTTAPDYDDTWDNLYANVIAQSKLAEIQAAEVNNKSVVGITQVMQAQAFGLASDLWGDVPFTEASDPIKFPTPKFDPQAEVYKGVQLLLDKAIANLTGIVGINGAAAKDIFYGGDSQKWIKAAYTLKARFYLHVKDYPNAIANAQNGINLVSGNMMARHGETFGSDFNVYYDFLTYNRPGYMNAAGAIAPAYLDSSDPKYRGNSKTDETARFNYLYQTGLNTGDLDPNVLVAFDWGNLSEEDGFFGAATSFPLVTFEENNLILAEALAKTNDLPGALNALNTHRAFMASGGYINSGYVALGLQYDPYLLTDFAPAGIENSVASGQTVQQALLKEILEERYVTFVGQIEQFNDVRRTKNALGIPPVIGAKIPQRFPYPQSELNTNPNTPKLASSDLFKETPVNTSAY